MRNVTITKVLGFPLFVIWKVLIFLCYVLNPWPTMSKYFVEYEEYFGCLVLPMFGFPVLLLMVAATQGSGLIKLIGLWYVVVNPLLLFLWHLFIYVWNCWSKYHDELVGKNEKTWTE